MTAPVIHTPCVICDVPMHQCRHGSGVMYANDPAKLVEANRWAADAAPLIDAYLELDQRVAFWMDRARDAPTSAEQWAAREMLDLFQRAFEATRRAINDFRDDVIADLHVGAQDDPCAQEEADAFNDRLSSETLSVQAAIKARPYSTCVLERAA